MLPGFRPAMPACDAALKAAMFVPAATLGIPTMGCCGICRGIDLGTD